MSTRNQIARIIAEDHRRLEDLIANVAATVIEEPHPHFDDWKLILLRELRDLQSQLQKHFDLEEHGGFMDEIVAAAPHCLPRVESLAHEHEAVLESLDRILTEFKHIDSAAAWHESDVRGRLLALFDVLKEHEEEENSLLQDAYFQDLGVGG